MLEIEGLEKALSGQPVLRGISLAVEAGETLALLGPSGCGKTTLLRVLAGLEAPDAGHLRFDGQDLAGLPAHRRGFGLMFQDYALFPHLTVRGNVAFGLRMQGLPSEALRRGTDAALAQVGLSALAERDVAALSGGERQRVALARCLAPRPRLLMLDEPLAALDRPLRDALLAELREILEGAGLTALYVTHDQAEALAVADRVALMRSGRLEQVDRPQALYRRPATVWAARFLGQTNLVPARQEPDGRMLTPWGAIRLPRPAPPGAVTLLLPPHSASLDTGQAEDLGPGESPRLIGTLVHRRFGGDWWRVTVALAGLQLEFRFPPTLALPRVGEPIALRLDPAALVLLPAEA